MNRQIRTYVVGFPRIGEKRELKKALEGYWAGKTGFNSVAKVSRELRRRHWRYQQQASIDFISSNDFSLYDNMLDTVVMFGAIPERFRDIGNKQERYFAMARGTQNAHAMEMTKWFNTNYHFIVPELSKETTFSLNADKVVSEYGEAKALGIKTKINLIGPITFLSLSKRVDGKGDGLDLLPELLPHYASLLDEIARLDDEVFVQLDEPSLVKDPDSRTLDLLHSSYDQLRRVSANLNLIVITYFDHAREAATALRDVPIYGMGLDFIYGPENLTALAELHGKKLIAGLIDGRNIWRNDYEDTLARLNAIEKQVDPRDIILSTSCSLLHVPYSLEYEEASDPEVKRWMSFAREKLGELAGISAIHNKGNDFNAGSEEMLEEYAKAFQSRRSSSRTCNETIRKKVRSISRIKREGTFPERNEIQRRRLRLPLLPTTTIGSFPQTDEIRKLRRNYRNQTISHEEYLRGIKGYIDSCLKFQEDIGLDVLVHGEPERNDMVEYFGEQLSGVLFTQNGWVQSYGSRCVKPPVVFGDVDRPKPMTVDVITYAQSRTSRPVKGILTGPVTILNWSFVRNDLERSSVCEQIAAALRDEVRDLQNAGIRVIQVDEAAFKEGYPLRKAKIADYETWAVRCFQLTVSEAVRETQIHTHMCYSDFSDITRTIEKMDADVIFIETARSGDRLLEVFTRRGYGNEIGPGVYDIHSARVPSVEELEEKIRTRIKALSPVSRLWVNPDCGLKTRDWPEVKQSLQNMATATGNVRAAMLQSGGNAL